MDIQTQGKVVDYLYKKLSPKYPEIIPDDLRSMIYKILKKDLRNIKDTKQLENILEENDLIANVKERYSPSNSQPFGVARKIVRRIRSDYL
tara:strand:+ start:5311 stop:5583 length:273 start_codon:yes stop_codon:yes gene_type:complete